MSLAVVKSNIPQRYTYVASVVANGLERILAGSEEKIPDGAIRERGLLFELATDQIHFARKGSHRFHDVDYPHSSFGYRSMAYVVVSDIIRNTILERPDASASAVNSEIERLNEAMKNPGPLFLRHNREEYEKLRKFFLELKSLGHDARYAEAMGHPTDLQYTAWC